MTASGPLQPVNLFHTGIVVKDLEAAKNELGDRLGLTWTEGGADIILLTDDGVQQVPSAYAMSKEGPHHVELALAVPGTVWTVTSEGQAHHLGYWVDDVRSSSAALVADGVAHVATVAMAVDAPPMCAYHRTASGLLVEVVSRGLRRVLLPDS
jgi:catechol 2,3-dioxygenase-like lactoylglutathione lyase family enzyme